MSWTCYFLVFFMDCTLKFIKLIFLGQKCPKKKIETSELS